MPREKKTIAKKTIRKRASHIVSKSIPVIQNQKDYDKVIAQIEQLVKEGNSTIREQDMALYQKLAKAAQAYEKSIYTIPPPSTLEGLLEWKMYELKLKQKGLAKKLHISDAKLSLVMSGKQRPDATLLKSIHDRLGVDGNLLLSVIKN